MTLRERIADWISGGALTEARNHVLYEAGWRDRACDAVDNLVRARHRLGRIAAQETPNANATVRRMARIARGEE